MSGSPKRCSRPRSPRASPPAAGCGSAPPGSPRTRRWRSSTSPSSAAVKKQVIEHLGQLDFLHAKQNVILLGPPGHRQDPHLDRAWGSAPASPASACSSKPRPNGSRSSPTRNAKASSTQELDRLERIPLLVCDEVGYIPFDPQAASLMFMLVSRRYERRSLIVTSNKPFSAWGEIFGDDMAATAMVDRLIHHAEILSLKGDSYRLKDRDLGPRPGRQSAEIA